VYGVLDWEGQQVIQNNDVWDVGAIDWPGTFNPDASSPYAASQRVCF
jgi:hypothetical protein